MRAVEDTPRTAARGWGLVWALFAASSALYFLSGNEADNDLWVHLKIGLDILRQGTVPHFDSYSYTAAGATWIDHEWLTHLLFGAVYRAGGDPALLGLKLAIAATTAALLARSVARRAASPHVRGVILVLAFAVLARGFAIRPQIISYALVAFVFCWLDALQTPGVFTAAALAASIVLWANLHGGVLLGVGIAGLYALWLLGTDKRAAVRIGIATALAVVAALFANPYGPSLGTYLFHELSAPHPITEWQPLAWEPAQATFLALAALFVIALPFVREWRRRGWEVALAALLFWMAFHQQRHTPLFAIAAAPVIAAGLQRRARDPALAGTLASVGRGTAIDRRCDRRAGVAADRLDRGPARRESIRHRLPRERLPGRRRALHRRQRRRRQPRPAARVGRLRAVAPRPGGEGLPRWALCDRLPAAGRRGELRLLRGRQRMEPPHRGLPHQPRPGAGGERLRIRDSTEWRPVYVDSVAIVYARRDSPEVRPLPPLVRNTAPVGMSTFP